MSLFYRFARMILTPIFIWISPVKIIGKENIPPNEPFIVCSNHTSMSDPMFLIPTFKRQIFFMAKIELFKNPIIRFVFNLMGIFGVDRGKGDMNAIHTAEDIINGGKILGIYPEGTRYKEGPPRKAKSGVAYIAMSTKADILPVSVYREGSYKFFKKTTIRIGHIIKHEELVSEERTNRENLKFIVDKVTGSITELWEMKH